MDLTPFVSVIIPTYERGAIAAQTLRRVLRETYPSYEVIVVDQSPQLSATLRDAVESSAGKARLVRPRSIGLPSARNAGIQEARGELIVFCDDDMEPGPGFISAFLHPYEDARVGAVAGRVIEPDATPDPARKGVVGDAGLFGNKEIGLDSTQRGPATTFKGGFFSLRRSAAVAVGGFDEGFVGPAFREDSDMSARLLQNGWQVVFEPDACARHGKALTGGLHSPQHERQRLILENEVRYTVRHLRGLRLVCWLLGRWRAMVLPRWNLARPIHVFRLSCAFWSVVWRGVRMRNKLRSPVNYLAAATNPSD